MTDTIMTTLPREVIQQDARYEQTIADGQEAAVERDRLRWEWTRCPNGPMLTFTEYGRQVSRDEATIRRSADAVTRTGATPDSVTCRYDHARYEPTSKPTEEEVKAHGEAKHRVTAGEVGSLIVRTLATLTGRSENTIEHNATWTPLQQEARKRAADEVPTDAADATERIKVICREVYQKHKDHEAAVIRAKNWMAEHRAVRASEIPMSDARAMVDRIKRTAKRKSLTFADAEQETRDWDHKAAKAERIKNEQVRAARLAVLELREAAARAKDAGTKVIAATRKIEEDAVPLTEDERTLALSDLDAAEAAIRLARASLGGESGTDWDAELQRLGEVP